MRWVANNLGLLPGQVTNFLENAAQGTAVYSASLSSQPIAAPLIGAPTAPIAGVLGGRWRAWWALELNLMTFYLVSF
jgi:hypothetical protein